jgi:hypothetical protein
VRRLAVLDRVQPGVVGHLVDALAAVDLILVIIIGVDGVVAAAGLDGITAGVS